MSNLYWLTDEQMARLKPFFPKSHGCRVSMIRCPATVSLQTVRGGGS